MTSRVTAGLIAGRYEVLREIGRGGMATVVEARDRERDVVVAVKRLRDDIASAVNTARFLREVGLARSLSHPGILPLLDSGTGADGLPYYVMPLVEGESLRERLVRERQLPVEDALAIVLQVADALAFAHAQGIVHRDVTPANILLSGSRTYLADFGIARAVLVSDGDTLTSTGIVIGTPEYMSPEQGAGDHDVDERGDLYALASVLYTCLAGEPPFTGPSQQSVLARKAVARAPSVRDLRPTVSLHLASVIARALEPVPADRYRTVREFAAAMIATPPLSPSSVVRRRQRARVGAVTGVLVLLAVAGLGFASEAGRQRRASLHDTVARGDIGTSVEDLRAIVQRDSGDASAALWLAQALLLRGDDSTPDWHRAVSLASRITSPAADAARARAFSALAMHRRGAACEAFREVRKAEPTEVAATFDVADCLGRDDAVVPDARSPSGWRFRSSRDEAIRLFDTLLVAVGADSPLRPVVLRRLVPLFLTEWGTVRSGRSANDSTRLFGAFPKLIKSADGDSIAYEPHPLSEFGAGGAWMDPPGLVDAIEHDRSAYRAAAFSLADAEPGVSEAHEMLARALELSGELAATSPGARSALSEISRARQLLRDPRHELSLRFSQVRLLVKNGDFAAARVMADSAIALSPRADQLTIKLLSPLLALTGRARELSSMFMSAAPYFVERMPNGKPIHPHAVLARSTLAFSAYAQAGGPRDSIVASRRRFERDLRSYASPQSRDSVRVALIARPLSLAVPVIGPEAVVALPNVGMLIRPQQALARGDLAAVRVALDSLRQLRSPHAAATARIDQTYQEAWLRLAIGDSTGAARQLDDALNGLPALGTSFLGSIAEAASVGRAMTLRGKLAARRDGTSVAAQWSDRARALLAGADPELRPQ